MLVIKYSKKLQKEKSWVIDVVLNEFLGLSYEIFLDDEEIDNIVIELKDKKLSLNSTLFAYPKNDWLKKESLPKLPLEKWKIPDSINIENILNEETPIIYGTSGFNVNDKNIGFLNIDIFGSIFFMLSRYEELVLQETDTHQRFPATASLAYKSQFLHRPIVDEYVEIFWGCLKTLWPELERKKRIAKQIISCDVDDPYSKSVKNIKALPKEIAVALIKHKNIRLASSLAINSFASRIGNYKFEPYDTFNWMMDCNEQEGNSITFYFIAGNTAGSIDGCYSLKESRIRSLMKQIHERGHKIGLHGSYGTYNNSEQLNHEANLLRNTMDELGITQNETGCRQHYLRWKTPDTAINLNNAGFDYDSTLSYSDRPGFRCGTCHEYSMFDLTNRKPLKLKQRPLIVMECSIISKRYGGLGYSKKSLETFHRYKEISMRFDGNFTLLWHNSHLMTNKDRMFYKELIKPISTAGEL